MLIGIKVTKQEWSLSYLELNFMDIGQWVLLASLTVSLFVWMQNNNNNNNNNTVYFVGPIDRE